MRLQDVVDAGAVQALMDDFYGVTGVGMALLDLDGEVLVRTGWQDICTRFHRVHPVTRSRCIESDTVLSRGVAPGEFKQYRCRNGMWDMATPVSVDGRHIGNVFLGQFFFDDEQPDVEWFRAQATEFEFDQNEYLAALRRVPRWSREHVDAAMSFYARFATLVSELGHAKLGLERSLAEKEELTGKLHAKQRELQSLVDNSPDLVVRFDRELRHVFGNRMAEVATGLTEDASVGLRPSELPIPPGNAAFMEQSLRAALESGELTTVEQSLPTPAGATYFETSIVPELGESGEIETLLAVSRDVSERRRAEEALRDAEAQMRTLFEACPQAIFVADFAGRLLDGNPAAQQLSGFSREELVGMNLFETVVRPSAAVVKRFHEKLAASGGGSIDLQLEHKDGSLRWVTLSAAVVGEDRVIGYCTDITERKRREARRNGGRRRSEVREKLLGDLLAARSDDDIYAALARAVVRIEPGSRAVGARLDPDEGVLRFGGYAGFEGVVRRAVAVMGSDPRKMAFPYERLPEDVRSDIARGRLFRCRGDLADLGAGVVPRRVARAASRLLGIGSIHKVGLTLDGTVYGELTILLRDGRRLDHPELVETTVHEAALALKRLHAEQRAVHSAAALGRALEGTVEAMGTVIEMRDPYTAGHERRVTELAQAIAERLGYSDERRTVLRLAGTVHDLGKIAIPAEILSKPGQLTPMEMHLVRRHPEVAWEILRGVEFEGPVAEVVLQHHERMDGSGYPRGLSGDAILPEARVLAVADVVEAMASHRPYRPALGMDAALREIENGRGTLYDPVVVDACLAVFREGGYDLSPEE